MSKAQIDINACFGELRSALNDEALTQEGADEIWRHLFEMATQAPAQFYDEVEPYVRQSGFFERGLSIPMFRDSAGFEAAYEALDYNAVWRLYDEGDDLCVEVGYGVALPLEAMTLLGSPSPQGHKTLWLWRDAMHKDDDATRTFLVVDVEDILAQDATIKAKQKLCDKRFDEVLGARAAAARRDAAPALYVRTFGFKVSASLTIGPVEEIEGSEEKWPSHLDGRGLDVVREHSYYDQDMETDGPALRCAKVQTFWGQSVERLSLEESLEKSALARLKKAGLSPSRSYRFIAHM